MKTYETVTILKPQLNDSEVASFVENAKGLIASHKGEIVSEEKLGRRRLSHEIAKNREGFYVYFKFKAETSFIKLWADNMKINASVLRSIVMNYTEPKAKPVKKVKTEAVA